MTKTCTRCKLEKPMDDFRPRPDKRGRKAFRHARCNECRSLSNAESYQRRKQRDPDYARRVSDQAKLAKYGLTIEDYERMYREQGGQCAICNGASGPRDRRLAVDHCHKTGRVRALLCLRCNTGIGALGDDPSRVVAAAAYLIQHEDALEAVTR